MLAEFLDSGDPVGRAELEDRLIAANEVLWAGRTNRLIGLGGGDDCAILRPTAEEDLLLTTDQVVEGQHFLRQKHPPETVGRKALVRSLSDVAAMGGTPVCLLQTVCLPDWAIGDWHDAFQNGMRAAADSSGTGDLALAGGDVSGGDRFVATTTVVGRVERGSALRRSGACPGDAVCVSGSLGGAGMGLSMVLAQHCPDWTHPAVRRHCQPSARVELGQLLRKIPVSAAIDLSDGLAIDANRLARASNVAVIIDPSSLPLFPGASQDGAITSGEEHELLFTVADTSTLPDNAEISVIGRVDDGDGVWLETVASREQLPAKGFSHFGNRSQFAG